MVATNHFTASWTVHIPEVFGRYCGFLYLIHLALILLYLPMLLWMNYTTIIGLLSSHGYFRLFYEYHENLDWGDSVAFPSEFIIVLSSGTFIFFNLDCPIQSCPANITYGDPRHAITFTWCFWWRFDKSILRVLSSGD